MCRWPQSLTKLISNYKLLLYKVKSKFGGIVTKLISNYTLLLYKLKSKFGATVTKLIFNHMLLLYKVKSKFGATMSKLISNYTLWLHCNSYAENKILLKCQILNGLPLIRKESTKEYQRILIYFMDMTPSQVRKQFLWTIFLGSSKTNEISFVQTRPIYVLLI